MSILKRFITGSMVAGLIAGLGGCGAGVPFPGGDDQEEPQVFLSPVATEADVKGTTKMIAGAPVTDVMDQKLNDAIGTLQDPGAQEQVHLKAVDQIMESLFMSNLVVLPTQGVPEADPSIADHDQMLTDAIAALNQHINTAGFAGTEASKAAAWEARNFLQVFQEAAEVIGQQTAACDPQTMQGPSCDLLRAPDEGGVLVDSVLNPCSCDLDHDDDVDHADLAIFKACARGPALPVGPGPGCDCADLDGDGDADQTDFAIIQRAHAGENNTPGPCDAQTNAFSREVRSPFFAGTPSPDIQEQVIVPDSLAEGECAVVLKEIQGVKAVVRPVLIPIWVEPWYARATIVGFKTVWIWEFVPAEFLKTISYCNSFGTLTTNVEIQTVLERQLLHFWSFMRQDVTLHEN